MIVVKVREHHVLDAAGVNPKLRQTAFRRAEELTPPPRALRFAKPRIDDNLRLAVRYQPHEIVHASWRRGMWPVERLMGRHHITVAVANRVRAILHASDATG